MLIDRSIDWSVGRLDFYQCGSVAHRTHTDPTARGSRGFGTHLRPEGHRTAVAATDGVGNGDGHRHASAQGGTGIGIQFQFAASTRTAITATAGRGQHAGRVDGPRGADRSRAGERRLEDRSQLSAVRTGDRKSVV